MRTGLTLLQTNIIDADVKSDVSWLFEIDRTGNGSVDDYWSTKAKTWNGQAYTFKVMDFAKIKMTRGQSEYGIQAPSSFSFTLTNANNTLHPSDFVGGNVTVRLVAAADLSLHVDGVDLALSSDLTEETGNKEEGEILTWNFDIVNVSTAYQTLTFECRDWLQKYIEDAFYPNTPLIHHLWPTNEYGSYDYCVPLVFGTVYTPVPSAWIATDRFYILGADAPTYTISKARNPDKFGTKVEWLPADFTFTQSTKTVGGVSYKALQVIAADANSDGVMDANITFLDGEEFLPLSVKLSRSDLASMTSPVDILEYILEDMGIPSARIDATTQAAVKAVHAGWGLAFNMALVKQEDRKTLLARLLRMAQVELIVRDKIYFKVHSKVSQADIEKEWVLDGTFDYSAIVPAKSDCGYVIYPHVSGDVPVTSMNKALIPAKATTAVKSSIEVEAYYIFNSQYAQKIGTLALQRELLPNKEISFSAKGKALALEPDDVITINPADYGAGTGKEYDVLIDSMAIGKDLGVDFSCTGFSAALDDWADLSPTAVTVGTDATLSSYQPVTAGPDSDPDATGKLPNVLPGRLRIGEGTSYILFDPATPLRISEYDAGVEIYRAGNLNGFLGYTTATYGLAIGSATAYFKYDQVAGLRIAGDIKSSDTVGTTKGLHFSAADNELYFYGDDGQATIRKLASIGIRSALSDSWVGVFGSDDGTAQAIPNSTHTAIVAQSLNMPIWARAETEFSSLPKAGIAIDHLINLQGVNAGAGSIITGLDVLFTKNCAAGYTGNLTALNAIKMAWTHAGTTESWTATTVNGLLSDWDFNKGTVGTFRELYLKGHSAGTVTVGYSIYQENAALKNYFAGSVTCPDINFTEHTPTTLAGDINNWDLGGNTFIRAAGGTADRIVTGIVARASGHFLIITNVGTTNKLSFANESASSTAANRIMTTTAGTIEITPAHTAIFIYDATSSRWREMSHL